MNCTMQLMGVAHTDARVQNSALVSQYTNAKAVQQDSEVASGWEAERGGWDAGAPTSHPNRSFSTLTLRPELSGPSKSSDVLFPGTLHHKATEAEEKTIKEAMKAVAEGAVVHHSTIHLRNVQNGTTQYSTVWGSTIVHGTVLAPESMHCTLQHVMLELIRTVLFCTGSLLCVRLTRLRLLLRQKKLPHGSCPAPVPLVPSSTVSIDPFSTAPLTPLQVGGGTPLPRAVGTRASRR